MEQELVLVELDFSKIYILLVLLAILLALHAQMSQPALHVLLHLCVSSTLVDSARARPICIIILLSASVKGAAINAQLAKLQVLLPALHVLQIVKGPSLV
jgi:hypothetical protein